MGHDYGLEMLTDLAMHQLSSKPFVEDFSHREQAWNFTGNKDTPSQDYVVVSYQIVEREVTSASTFSKCQNPQMQDKDHEIIESSK